MSLKLNTSSGSITIVPENGSGNANVTLPRAGIGSVSSLSDLSITATAAELNIMDDVTATTAELNLLDGVTATTAELNYMDGVTSNVQTQLGLKSNYATVTVTVSGGNFVIDGTSQQALKLTPSLVYRFDQSDNTNSNHPIAFSTTSDGTHGGGSAYTVGITSVGTPGSAGAYTQVALEQDAPATLYFYCVNHSGMGSSAAVGGISTLAGFSITSTAAELNKLDGATLSTTELNYVTGVTSGIQTQIDTKAPLASPNFTGTAQGVNLTLSGNLTVNGTTSTIASTNTVVSDALIELANGATGTPSNDAGLVIERGDSDNAFIGFDESADKFIVGTGSFTGSSTGDLTITTGTLVANVEGTANLTTLTVDDITINGSTISDAGDLTIDSGGDIILDADGGDILIKDGATHVGSLRNVSSDFVIQSIASDNNIIFKGIDGGSEINALALDMSDGGTAIFYHDIKMSDLTYLLMGDGNDLELSSDGTNGKIAAANGDLLLDVGGDIILDADGADIIFKDAGTQIGRIRNVSSGELTFQSDVQDKDIVFNGNDGGSTVTALTLDMSEAGAATFNSTVTATGATVNGTLDIEEVYEKVNVSNGTTGAITFNTLEQGINFYNVNQTANRTINFSNVNANLAIGQSVTVAVLMAQGSTAYYLNGYQVDGSSVTPKWSGGSAPSAGNASSIDSYSFTIIKTANATFTVLASLTAYA